MLEDNRKRKLHTVQNAESSVERENKVNVPAVFHQYKKRRAVDPSDNKTNFLLCTQYLKQVAIEVLKNAEQSVIPMSTLNYLIMYHIEGSLKLSRRVAEEKKCADYVMNITNADDQTLLHYFLSILYHSKRRSNNREEEKIYSLICSFLFEVYTHSSSDICINEQKDLYNYSILEYVRLVERQDFLDILKDKETDKKHFNTQKVIQFLKACKKGDLNKVKSYLKEEEGKFLLKAQYDGITALYNACIRKNIKLLKILLDYAKQFAVKLQIDFPNFYNSNIFHTSSTGKNATRVFLKEIFSCYKNYVKEKIDQFDIKGKMPLSYACSSKIRIVIRFFLENKISLYKKDKAYEFDFFRQMHEKEGIILLSQFIEDNLFESYEIKGASLSTLLFLSLQHGGTKEIASIIRIKPQAILLCPDFSKENFLYEACTKARYDIVGFINSAYLEYFETLMKQKKNLNDRVTFHAIIEDCAIEMTKKLLSFKVDFSEILDAKGNNVLHYLLLRQDPNFQKIVEILRLISSNKDYKFNPNIQEHQYYRTILHIACSLSNPDLIECMLKLNPDLSLRDKNSSTAYDILFQVSGAASCNNMQQTNPKIYHLLMYMQYEMSIYTANQTIGIAVPRSSSAENFCWGSQAAYHNSQQLHAPHPKNFDTENTITFYPTSTGMLHRAFRDISHHPANMRVYKHFPMDMNASYQRPPANMGTQQRTSASTEARQHPTTVMGIPQQRPSANMGAQQCSTEIIMSGTQQRTSASTEARQHPTTVMGIPQQRPSANMGARQHPTVVMGIPQQRPSANMGARQHPTVVMGIPQQRLPANMGARQHPTVVMGIPQQRPPANMGAQQCSTEVMGGGTQQRPPASMEAQQCLVTHTGYNMKAEEQQVRQDTFHPAPSTLPVFGDIAKSAQTLSNTGQFVHGNYSHIAFLNKTENVTSRLCSKGDNRVMAWNQAALSQHANQVPEQIQGVQCNNTMVRQSNTRENVISTPNSCAIETFLYSSNPVINRSVFENEYELDGLECAELQKGYDSDEGEEKKSWCKSVLNLDSSDDNEVTL